MVHELKIDNCYLVAKLDGLKLFEIRCNDREYQKGDIVVYAEYNPFRSVAYHMFEILYVTGYMQQQNYVVFGERFVRTTTERTW